MKTTYQLSPFIASLIAHCYDSARATQQFAREIVAEKETPTAVKFAFTDVAATLRSPIERIERGIPSVKQQEFQEHIVDADPLIFKNIQYLYSRMTKEKKELLELAAEHILKGGKIEFEDEKVKALAVRPGYEAIMNNVIRFVCQQKGLSEKDLTGKCRDRDIAYPRQLCIYVISKKTFLKHGAIGKRIGDRDRTTIRHSIQTIQDLVDTDNVIKEEVEYFMGIDYTRQDVGLKVAV